MGAHNQEKIAYIGKAGTTKAVVDYAVRKGKEFPKAMMVIVINNDNTWEFMHTPNEYLLKMGALTSAQHDLLISAMNWEETE